MKKIIITTAATIIVGTVGVNYVVQGKETSEPKTTHYTIEEQVLSKQIDNRQLVELSILKEMFTLNGLTMDIVEDNDEKRVILLEDKNGIPLYKSIFMKDIERLKIVDFRDGLLYDNLLNEKETGDYVKKQGHRQVDIKDTKAQEITKKHIDLDTHMGRVIEDNNNERIIVYENKSGIEKYKTIYIKNKKHLKIIDFDAGLIFDGTIDEKKKRNDKPKTKETTTSDSTAKQTGKKKQPKKEVPKPNNNSMTNYKEYSKLVNHINMSDYSGSVVEDNQGKRVIVFKNANGKHAYKSIYINKKEFLKIIDLHGGLLDNGNL